MLQNQITKEVGVTVSVGLSYNKFLAKTASDLDKPNGFAIIGRAEALDFLANKPVEFIYGIGPAFAAKLTRQGLHKISDIRRISDKEMARRFGDNGLRLARLARAEDHRRVNPVSMRKSVSAETTFHEDIADIESLKDKLWQVCLKTADRSKAKNLAGRVITLKLKTARFKTITRRTSLPQAVQLADMIFRTLEPMLEKEANGTAYRLIGAGLSDLSEPIGDIGSMLDPQSTKRHQAERASDIARARFGTDAVMTGRRLRRKTQESALYKKAAHSLPSKPPPDQQD